MAINRLDHQKTLHEKASGGPRELKTHFTYYFFKSDNKHKKKTAEDVVRLLLKILCINVRPLPAQVKNIYRRSTEKRTPLKYEDFLDALISCALELSAFVFFDALDECSDEKLEDVIELLKRLVKSGVRVLLTSQPHRTPRVTEIGHPFARCQIMAHKDDLETYISEELQTFRPKFLKEEYETMQSKLVGEAEGM